MRVHVGIGRWRYTPQVPVWSGNSHPVELNAVFRACCMLRRTKAECVRDLPALTRTVVRVPEDELRRHFGSSSSGSGHDRSRAKGNVHDSTDAFGARHYDGDDGDDGLASVKGVGGGGGGTGATAGLGPLGELKVLRTEVRAQRARRGGRSYGATKNKCGPLRRGLDYGGDDYFNDDGLQGYDVDCDEGFGDGDGEGAEDIETMGVEELRCALSSRQVLGLAKCDAAVAWLVGRLKEDPQVKVKAAASSRTCACKSCCT